MEFEATWSSRVPLVESDRGIVPFEGTAFWASTTLHNKAHVASNTATGADMAGDDRSDRASTGRQQSDWRETAELMSTY